MNANYLCNDFTYQENQGAEKQAHAKLFQKRDIYTPRLKVFQV